jgi:hypothetical protein
MWYCKRCNEAVEDAFDTCWNCGTSHDGTPDPAFQRVPDDAEVPDPGADDSTNPYSSPADVRSVASNQAQAAKLPEDVRRLLAGTSPAVFFMSILCGIAALLVIIQLVAFFQTWYLIRDSAVAQMTLITRAIILAIWMTLAYLLWNYGTAMRRVARNDDSYIYPMFMWQRRFWIVAAISVTTFVIIIIIVAIIALSMF